MSYSDPVSGESVTEREKWELEVAFRERELALKEKEQATSEKALELKRLDHFKAAWRNPLVIAVVAAAMAAAGNAVVTLINGNLQRQIEDQKSEQTRILEMIKTGDPDKAAANLEFLLNAGLITNAERARKLRHFLDRRKPGSGPALFPESASIPRLGVSAEDEKFYDVVILVKSMIEKLLDRLNNAVDTDRLSNINIEDLRASAKQLDIARKEIWVKYQSGEMESVRLTKSGVDELLLLNQKILDLDQSDAKQLIEVSSGLSAFLTEKLELF